MFTSRARCASDVHRAVNIRDCCRHKLRFFRQGLNSLEAVQIRTKLTLNKSASSSGRHSPLALVENRHMRSQCGLVDDMNHSLVVQAELVLRVLASGRLESRCLPGQNLPPFCRHGSFSKRGSPSLGILVRFEGTIGTSSNILGNQPHAAGASSSSPRFRISSDPGQGLESREGRQVGGKKGGDW